MEERVNDLTTEATLNVLSINRDSAVPLYFQLKEQIKSLILSGAYKPFDQLPTEEELCKSLNVSRPVIRQAYSELIKENLIGRKKGSGTYVMEIPQKNLFKEYVSFSFEKGIDLENRSKIIEFETLYNKTLLEKYKVSNSTFRAIKEEDKVYSITRVLDEYGFPTMILHFFVFEKTAPKFDRCMEELKTHSIVETFEKNYGIRLMKAKRSLHPVIADENVGKVLRLKENELVYHIETQYYDELNRLIIVEYLTCSIDRMSFEVDVRR